MQMFLSWGAAVISHWFALVGGAVVSVVLLMWAQFAPPDQGRLPSLVWWTGIAAGFVVASHLAWRDERTRADAATVVKPDVRLWFSCGQFGPARLVVTNDGAGAEFVATVRANSLISMGTEHKAVRGRWEEVATPAQWISNAGEGVLRLASAYEVKPWTQETGHMIAWELHRADGGDVRGVDDVEELLVTFTASPDLKRPCRCRVILRPDGRSEMTML